MDNAEADREFLNRASSLAFDIAQRGVNAVADFMKSGVQVPAPADEAAGGIEQALRLASDGLDQARQAVVATQTAEQSRFEAATVELIGVVGPKVIGAAARMLTGRAGLSDDEPRANTVRILQELGRRATSLLNDSVGGAAMGNVPDIPDVLEPAIVRLALAPGAVEVEFGLENTGVTPVNPTENGVSLHATPLIGETDLIQDPEVRPPPDEIRAQASGVVRLYVGAVRPAAGTYRGFVYALWNSEPVACAALELTVAPETNGGEPARPTEPDLAKA